MKHYHTTITRGSRTNIRSVNISVASAGNESGERGGRSGDVEPVRRETNAARDEYHVRVRLRA